MLANMVRFCVVFIEESFLIYLSQKFTQSLLILLFISFGYRRAIRNLGIEYYRICIEFYCSDSQKSSKEMRKYIMLSGPSLRVFRQFESL